MSHTAYFAKYVVPPPCSLAGKSRACEHSFLRFPPCHRMCPIPNTTTMPHKKEIRMLWKNMRPNKLAESMANPADVRNPVHPKISRIWKFSNLSTLVLHLPLAPVLRYIFPASSTLSVGGGGGLEPPTEGV
jgi:hypothetical protein